MNLFGLEYIKQIKVEGLAALSLQTDFWNATLFSTANKNI